MKPLKLVMQAFGSYGNRTEIDFERPVQNLFLVTGDTGAGKSTIFDAIVFALYGEASSSLNRKDGMELQSQFVPLDVEPFVELTFYEEYAPYASASRGEGAGAGPGLAVSSASRGEGAGAGLGPAVSSASRGQSAGYSVPCKGQYRVRRVPRHKRAITRKTSRGGVRDVSESVTLWLPDGTEYPQKEADRKLEEIVGLSKNQFMQVAMIAQGEFMELLRAKTEAKKEIFRKLFGTELYQQITEELKARKQEKEKEVAKIRVQCQMEASRTVIPEDYGRKGLLAALLEEMKDGTLVQTPQFLEELGLLLEDLGKGQEEAEAAYQAASRQRDEKYSALAGAQALLDSFHSLEEARKKLRAYEAHQGEIEEAKRRSERIEAAYQVEVQHRFYQNAVKEAQDVAARLKKLQDGMPELLMRERGCAEEEQTRKEAYDVQVGRFSMVSEKVGKAMQLFEAIAAAQEDLVKKERACQAAQKEVTLALQSLEELGRQEADWRKQVLALGELTRQCTLWEKEAEDVRAFQDEEQVLRERGDEISRLLVEMEDLEKKYAAAKKEYLDCKGRYDEMRQSFLDAQAGFLARGLRPGAPCPVCGSTQHPNPCKINTEHVDFTQEELEALQGKVESCGSHQQELALKAGSHRSMLQEKQASYDVDFGKLWRQVAERISKLREPGWTDVPEASGEAGSLAELDEMVRGWKRKVISISREKEKERNRLNQVQKDLENIGPERERKNQALTKAQNAQMDALQAYEGQKSVLKTLEESKEYPTQEEAKAALAQAKEERARVQKAYQAAQEAAQKAKKLSAQAQTQANDCMKQLPDRKKKQDDLESAYRAILSEKSFSEEEWKGLVARYDREEASRLKERVEEYHRGVAAASAVEKSALEAIGGRKKPCLDELSGALKEAEQAKKDAESLLQKRRADYREDRQVYDSLSTRLKSRQGVVEEHKRLEELYRLVSGNVSGSRMDLETFVQRYYLERILYAANRRFLEMSASQFELRLVGVEEAGSGKNRGLDLMVYSTVTGKEREVRTLSGGESFLAALSLALGMADQIQAASAAVNLDIMFIDEGFGSLDDHSRSQAVKMLLEMAEGSKLIGIISHVTELKQEIDDQLLVEKDEAGSHARWQIG